MTVPTPTRTRTRYALVGAGHRAQMYIGAVAEKFAGRTELVAWADTNPGRLDFYDEFLTDHRAAVPLRYDPSRIATMISEQAVDTVVVTSPDYTHAAVIVACLRGGADVIVEKPLTIDAAGCTAIATAVRETGRRVTVTFNYRYSPRNSALKEVIASGDIGDVTSVNFEWVLDTVHGADYFRRWHREKEKSGGLLIHKASHHFDLVNWWIDDHPQRVYASGGLRFYGAANARKRGLDERPERGTGDAPRTDPFAMDLREDERLRRLYLDNERHDGYLRDRDVFTDGITIEDNLAVVVDYAGGSTLSYSLNAHSPWEGYRVAVYGTAGRAELEVVERGAAVEGAKVLDPSATAEFGDPGRARPRGERLLVQRHWEQAHEVPIADFGGAHGGGDDMLLEDIFGDPAERAQDPLGRAADYQDGIASVAVGIAGNRSLQTGQPVLIADLLG